jgi:arylformamidase
MPDFIEKHSQVYRQYDQGGLDAEYNNQAKISEAGFKVFLDRCAALSEAARSQLPCHFDVRYGSHPAETMDIFPAQGVSGRAPVEIFFHGGYWRMLDKRDFSYVANGFVPNGHTAVIVNYGLVPSVTLDELVEQCRQAVAWVYKHIEEYQGDSSRLYLSGHSAGGHLVAMMLATDWRRYGIEDGEKIVCGATAISGIYDLEPIRLSFLNKILNLSQSTVEHNSPVNLRPICKSPLLVTVGALEGDEYVRQSSALTDAWKTAEGGPELILFEEDDHFSIREQLGSPDSPLVTLMMNRRKNDN